jgi:hypothetical protein
MYDTSRKASQLLANFESRARTWEDVAKEIVNEPDSEKLSFLVKELCEILDNVPKTSGGLRPQDTPG